jgi:hypothetical protein
LPVTNPQLTTSSALLAYGRVLDFFGQSAKLNIIVPIHRTERIGADFAGEVLRRDVSGFADPVFKLSVNLYGAPALSLREFAAYEQDLIVGASLRVSRAAGSVRRQQSGQSRQQPLVVQARTGALQSARAVDAGGHGGGNPVHRQQGLLSTATGVRRIRSIRWKGTIYSFSGGIWASLDAPILPAAVRRLTARRAATCSRTGALAPPSHFP